MDQLKLINLQGQVVKSTGRWYKVETQEGEILNCSLKGKFRSQGIKSTNPVAVGDIVKVRSVKNSTGVIYEILPRHNYIIRKATKLSKQSHIIAANIDQLVLIVTITLPRTSTGFIDRFLTTAEAYHIPSIIVFNKEDLYDAKDMKKLKHFIDIYSDASYQCIVTSAETGKNMEEVRNILVDKCSLVAGHSGVGKSTMINLLQPGLDLKVSELSTAHDKGLHTTTFAQMYKLHFGGYIIDTPGIKEFGLIDFKKTEIAERFPEFRKLMHLCRFSNCLHLHEPGCAVIEAVENGDIYASRYLSYLSIMENFD